MEKQKYTPGAKCSKNFVFKKQLTTMGDLYEVLENQPSIYWRHKVYPTAVIMQQKICLLAIGLKYGNLWEIEKHLDHETN